MKKILSAASALSFSAQNSLHLPPQRYVPLNRLRFVRFATNGPQNSLFEYGDLNVTEVESPEQIKKKDSAARPFDETLQLNVTVDWRSSNTEDILEEEKPTTIRRINPAPRIIKFKSNSQALISKYPASEQILTAAEKVGFPRSVITALIFTNPRIVTFNPDRVSSNLSQLLKLGFGIDEIKSMVRRYPDLLEYEGYDIFDTVEAWRTVSLSERFLIELFTRHPLFFSIPNDEAVTRLNRINYLMMKKINRVKSLLEKNAAIMDGDWNRVEENFTYFYKTMRVSEKDISRSRGLSLPLSFIKLRHSFLEKCGEYIRPKLKEEKGFNTRLNPPLYRILDTPDDVFATNVAKVSFDEYLVYKKLMKYEEAEPAESVFES